MSQPAIAMYETMLEFFADQAADAVTKKDRVIALRNMAFTACAVSAGEDATVARDLFVQTTYEHDVAYDGVINVGKWNDSLRVLDANLSPNTDPDTILADLMNGNPYLDLSVASHPSGTGTPRQLF